MIDFIDMLSIDMDDELVLANSKSRLRMVALKTICQKGLVVGTGNKVEDFGVGFYTKHGDGGVHMPQLQI